MRESRRRHFTPAGEKRHGCLNQKHRKIIKRRGVLGGWPPRPRSPPTRHARSLLSGRAHLPLRWQPPNCHSGDSRNPESLIESARRGAVIPCGRKTRKRSDYVFLRYGIQRLKSPRRGATKKQKTLDSRLKTCGNDGATRRANRRAAELSAAVTVDAAKMPGPSFRAVEE